MTDMTTGIKPCPFCGGPGKLISVMGEWVGKARGHDGSAYAPPRRRVVCAAIYENPSRACPQNATPKTDVEAIKAWNTREAPFNFFSGLPPVDIDLGSKRMEPEGLHLDVSAYQVKPGEPAPVFTIVHVSSRPEGGGLYRVDCNGERWMDELVSYSEALRRKRAVEASLPTPRDGL